MGTNIKKEIYDRLHNANKSIVLLKMSMKKDIHYTKEEICAVEAIRDKQQNLDTGKISDTVLGAAINKVYKLKEKNKFEADFDMYETITGLIEKEKIQKEPLDRYTENFSLLKEANKDKTFAKKFAEEQLEKGLIDEDDLKNIQLVAEMMQEQIKKEEMNKLSKELGKEIKDEDLSKKESVDFEKLQELIEELGLDDKLRIND